jgi:transposase
MAARRATLVDEGRALAIEASVGPGVMRVPADGLARALGWRLAPQGLCRADVCIPVRDPAALVREDGIDLAALAGLLDRPFVMDADAAIGVLGAAAAARADRLASTEAPDFTLPDLHGRLHSLRDQRGKKTLLVAWASW